MSLFARIALGLALVLPITAYVVGSLVAADPAPAQHSPIVLQESNGSGAGDPVLVDPDGQPGTSATPTSTPTPTPDPTPTAEPTKDPKPSAPAKTSEPAVVRPTAIDPDDDDYDDLDDDDDDDDETDD